MCEVQKQGEKGRGEELKKKKEREKTDFASDKILQLKLFLPARFSGRSAASRQVLGGDFGSGNGAFCTSQEGRGLLPSALSHPQVGAAGCCPPPPQCTRSPSCLRLIKPRLRFGIRAEPWAQLVVVQRAGWEDSRRCWRHRALLGPGHVSTPGPVRPLDG